MQQPFSLDRLNAVDPKLTGQAALAAIQSVEARTAEQQVAGLAVAFAAICRKYRIHPGTALTVANNVVERAVGKLPALRAAIQYVNQEL